MHWTSGIEAGLRLITWVWVRRLLDGWVGAAELFERNEVARAQIWWHQHYLASFRSRGSSANNHVIAEAAGLLVAALAFDWFAESSRWAEEAARVLEDELESNTFPSGVNREMAFDYHGFVAELAVVAAAEASWAGRPLSDDFWALLYRMFDVVAATVDAKLRAPRQGDGDNGTALVLDPPTGERWSGLLAIGEALFESPGWWPTVEPTVTSTLLASMAGRHTVASPDRRPSHYADAGLTLLRSSPSDGEEIWCRCDAGPHGFLSIAAHAHADALAVEVRYDGVDVLADPGTYCYHGEPRWRSYFRSTLAHNTIEVGGQDQSTSGGPFLWTRQARSSLIELETDAGRGGRRVVRRPRWLPSAHPTPSPPSDRYASPVAFGDSRSSTASRRQEDTPFRLAFHLGPDIDAADGRAECRAHLVRWPLHAKRHALSCPMGCLGRSGGVRPTRSSVGTPRALERSSQPGPSSDREHALVPAWTPIRPCSSSTGDLRFRAPVDDGRMDAAVRVSAPPWPALTEGGAAVEGPLMAIRAGMHPLSGL